jgi:lipid II isoglutaminyl synthase (glutamine-hydrolysing)
MTTSLKIVRIHNELLGTYGDQGNADVLAFRTKARSIDARVIDVSYLDVMPTDGDIYLMGGAEDAAQLLSLEALQRDKNLQTALDRGAVLLAICAGFQIIGNSFEASGKKVAGLGLLNVDSVSGANIGKKRFVGDIRIKSDVVGCELTGFENHAGYTTLGAGVQPLGSVVVGHGNGDDKYDGSVSGNIFGTYLHGPVLARNPEFADLLLSRALGEPLEPYNDPLATKYAEWRRKVTK